MAARPRTRSAVPESKHHQNDETEPLTAFERQREQRIRENKARIAALGLLEQASLLDSTFRVVKKPPQRRKKKDESIKLLATRASSRLKGSGPEFQGLSDDFTDSAEGLVRLIDTGSCKPRQGPLNEEFRCSSQSRGSLYDSKAGITCHFCRQKKLCGEKDCPRCSARDADLSCIGKSECSKCKSANGRFCRACLKIRYGMELEDVREQMEQGTWLCPHCYESDNPKAGWICNSSICMTRRGLKPTGIAIYNAQEQGFKSVAHQLQAKLLERAQAKEVKAR